MPTRRDEPAMVELTLNSRYTSIFMHTFLCWGKKAPRRVLRKTSHLFLFNCEPGRIDHDDLKDSNFEGDVQPEIAIWRRKYDTSSKFLPKVFDHGEILIALEPYQTALKF